MILLTICMCLHSGCSEQAAGFALPPGDTDLGKQTFVSLQCDSCHAIPGIVERSTVSADPSIYVVLGGEVIGVKTYGDLVTSIINPSHRFSRSRGPRNADEQLESSMRRYNDEMTVQQLIDLTTFLAGQYSVWSPQYVAHRYF